MIQGFLVTLYPCLMSHGLHMSEPFTFLPSFVKSNNIWWQVLYKHLKSSKLKEISCEKEFFLCADKNIVSYSLQLPADLPFYNIHHPLPQKKKTIAVNHFHSQQWSYYTWPYILISQKPLTILDTVEMGLITDT